MQNTAVLYAVVKGLLKELEELETASASGRDSWLLIEPIEEVIGKALQHEGDQPGGTFTITDMDIHGEFLVVVGKEKVGSRNV